MPSVIPRRPDFLGMHCVPEPLEHEAVADAVTVLCSQAARLIIGQKPAIEGGFTHGG